MVRGIESQSITIPMTRRQEVLKTGLMNWCDYKIFKLPWKEKFEGWILRRNPCDMWEFGDVLTGEFDTTIFYSHICKDCIKQLAQLFK